MTKHCVYNSARLLVYLSCRGSNTEKAALKAFVHSFPMKRISGRTQWGRVVSSVAEQIAEKIFHFGCFSFSVVHVFHKFEFLVLSEGCLVDGWSGSRKISSPPPNPPNVLPATRSDETLHFQFKEWKKNKFSTSLVSFGQRSPQITHNTCTMLQSCMAPYLSLKTCIPECLWLEKATRHRSSYE